MAKMDKDQIRDEVCVELYLDGIGIMDISRFTQTPYTRVQQLLYRRSINLTRPERVETDRAGSTRPLRASA